MRVAIAICTYNRAPLLRQTLDRLRQVLRPTDFGLEIVVINNNCTDDTDQVVASFADSLPIRLIHEPRKGQSAALNAAIEQVDADYLLFTDDDVLVSDTWLEAFVDATRRFPSAAVFGGPIEPWFPEPPDPDYLRAFPALASGFCGLTVDRPLGPLPASIQPFGANLAVRRASVGDLRFDPALGPGGTAQLTGGGEIDFIARLCAAGGEAIWVPSMRVAHYVAPARMRLRYLLSFMYLNGRVTVRTRGVPAGTRLLGVPRWLTGRVVAEGLRVITATLRGNRVQALAAAGEASRFYGLVRECRRIYRLHGDASPPAAPGLEWD